MRGVLEGGACRGGEGIAKKEGSGVDGKPVLEIVWQPAKAGSQVEVAKEMIGKGVAAIVISPDDDAAFEGACEGSGGFRWW